MIKYLLKTHFLSLTVILLCLCTPSCKHKQKIQKSPAEIAINDTVTGRCKLDFKSAKTLSAHVKENEFQFNWVSAKADVEANIDGEENTFVVRVKAKKDSAILITIEKLSIDVAKILITKDSVKLRIDLNRKQYFKGDFQYINDVLNADLDFDVLQAVMFGNSAEFYDDDEAKLKPVTDRTNCHYLLSTERKRRLRKIQGGSDLKKALQTLTLNPDNYKIIKNEFIDPGTNRIFTANYKNFTQKDSVYAPYLVDIDIVAEKKAKLKIEYVRIEKNKPQNLSLSIPKSYDPIQIQKK